MKYARDQTADDRLYTKALAIRYKRHVGLWLPITWKLALRGHTGAMLDLAGWLSDDNSAEAFGKPADSFCAAGLYRRAYRKGDALAAYAAYNAAMSFFNRNNMTGYRHWLARAAQAGDAAAGAQLRYFETRLWHTAARKIGRLRPQQKRDEFA
jgi:hypothetical protein